MSKALAPWARRGGALHLSIGVGEAPGFDVCGLRFDDRGRILAVSNGSLDHFHAGLPFNLHGRLIVSEAPVDHTDQNVTHSAASSSAVCIGPGPVAYWSEGLPYNSSGQIVYTESAPPPVIPPDIVEFLHDFTTATLGPFAHTRASDATGADHEGIIRTVGIDDPVFIGARVVRNIVPNPNDLQDWLVLDSSGNLTKVDNGTYSDLAFGADSNDRVYWRPDPVGLPAGIRVACSFELRHVSSGDQVILNYFDGVAFVGAKTVTVTSQWTRFAITGTSTSDARDEVQLRSTGAASQIQVRDVQFELTSGADNDAPSEFVDGIQHFTTTNGNTVDPVTGVVTEAPGTTLTTIEGLQLEGSRTNKLDTTDLMDGYWVSGPLPTREYSATIAAPDGSNTAVLLGNGGVDDGYLYASSGAVAGDILSVWARALSGTGTVNLLAFSGSPNPVTLTEEWQRFELEYSSGFVYLVDFRDPQSLDDILLWGPQSEVADFPSSFIYTPGTGATRAATACTASFTDIPDLPNAGLVNDFCGQVVFTLNCDWDDLPTDSRLFVLHSDADSTNNLVEANKQGSNLRVRARLNGSSNAIIFSVGGTGLLAGKTYDIRYRAQAAGFDAWLDLAKQSAPALPDAAQPVKNIDLMNDRDGGNNAFGIYKFVRIVPEALTDEQIEAW